MTSSRRPESPAAKPPPAPASPPITTSTFSRLFMGSPEEEGFQAFSQLLLQPGGVCIHRRSLVKRGKKSQVIRRVVRLTVDAESPGILCLTTGTDKSEFIDMSQIMEIHIGAQSPVHERIKALITNFQLANLMSFTVNDDFYDLEVSDPDLGVTFFAKWLAANAVHRSFVGAESKESRRSKSPRRTTARARQDAVLALHAAREVSTMLEGDFTRRSQNLVGHFSPEMMGLVTAHGQTIGQRGMVSKVNQDSGCIVTPFQDKVGTVLAVVMDGHAELGHHTSNFCMRSVVEMMQNDSQALANPGASLFKSFVNTHATLMKKHSRWGKDGGTTAVRYRPPRRLPPAPSPPPCHTLTHSSVSACLSTCDVPVLVGCPDDRWLQLHHSQCRGLSLCTRFRRSSQRPRHCHRPLHRPRAFSCSGKRACAQGRGLGGQRRG